MQVYMTVQYQVHGCTKGAGIYGGCINSFAYDSTISDTECETGCGLFLTDIMDDISRVSNVFENNSGDLVGGVDGNVCT